MGLGPGEGRSSDWCPPSSPARCQSDPAIAAPNPVVRDVKAPRPGSHCSLRVVAAQTAQLTAGIVDAGGARDEPYAGGVRLAAADASIEAPSGEYEFTTSNRGEYRFSIKAVLCPSACET